jgi:hypothetical protein
LETHLPFSFFSYLFSTALQATRWARLSSPYKGAALLPVLLFGRVEGLLVDLLRVFGQIVLHAIRQFADLPFGTFPDLLCLLASL